MLMIYQEIYYMIAEMRFHKRSIDFRPYISSLLYIAPQILIQEIWEKRERNLF